MARREPKGPQISIPVQVDKKRVLDLVCTGLEQGVGYWAEGLGVQLAKNVKPRDFAKGGKYNLCDYMDEIEHAAIHPGCCFKLRERDTRSPHAKTPTGKPKVLRLTYKACMRGLEIMARDWPWHFAAFVEEKDDRITADVFIQCAVFGDIIYS